MGKAAFAVKLDETFQKELREFCEAHGLKQGSFVEKALREQMEREELAEDLLDLYTLRSTEPHALDFETYLKRRK
jgi:predicted transcriptional regulator